MHWRHRATMLGDKAIALYALVICCWHIADKVLRFMHNPMSPKWGLNDIMMLYA